MTDEELAERIVALGVGLSGACGYAPTRIASRSDFQGAGSFVRDWRVAGALMEKVGHGDWFGSIGDWFSDVPIPGTPRFGLGSGGSLPRAICEACVLALGGVSW